MGDFSPNSHEKTSFSYKKLHEKTKNLSFQEEG